MSTLPTPEETEILAAIAERDEALRAMVAEARELLGRDVAPEAVMLAAETARALELGEAVPLRTLLHVCELALKLQGQPPRTVAGAIMGLLAKQAASQAPTVKRPKHGRG